MRVVAEGYSFTEAARVFKVKHSTLSDKFRKNQGQDIGRPTQLDKDTESSLVKLINAVAEWGYPLGECDIKDIVKTILDKNGARSIFVNKRSGCVALLNGTSYQPVSHQTLKDQEHP